MKQSLFFAQEGSDGKLDIPDEKSLHKVTARIEGGEGEVNGEKLVDDHGTAKITWNYDEKKYELVNVTVNGEVVKTSSNELSLDDIVDDKDVVIHLKPKKLTDNDKVKPGDFHEPKGNIKAIISGGEGIINGGGEITVGTDREVAWTVGDGYEVKYVFIDGILRKDLLDKTSVTLTGKEGEQTVVVILGKPGEVPVDVDKMAMVSQI